MQPLIDLWNAHGALSLPLLWMLLSLILNSVLATRTPEEWVAYAETNPKTALVINVIVRATGIDIVSMIQHVKTFIAQKANDNATKSEPK